MWKKMSKLVKSKRVYVLYPLVIVVLVLVVYACLEKESRKEYQAIPIESRTNSFSSDFYHVLVEYPIEQWDYQDNLKRYVDETVAFYRRDWTAGGMHYEDEMLAREQNPEREYPKFELNIRYEKFSSNKLNTHSYLYYTYIYTGGANGMTTVHSLNFNNNGLLGLTDVFQLNKKQEIQLTRLLAQKAASMPDVFDKKIVWQGLGLNFLKPDGLNVDSTKLKGTNFQFSDNFKNFIIGDEGVHFYFDKYKISSGDAGTPSVHLDWQQLTPFINNYLISLK